VTVEGCFGGSERQPDLMRRRLGVLASPGCSRAYRFDQRIDASFAFAFLVAIDIHYRIVDCSTRLRHG
jgi:hypothetical protein